MVSGDDRDDRRRVIIYGGGDLHYGVATRFVALLTETVCIAAPTPVTYVTPTLQALTVFDQEKHEKTYWQSFNTKAYGGRRKKK